MIVLTTDLLADGISKQAMDQFTEAMKKRDYDPVRDYLERSYEDKMYQKAVEVLGEEYFA